VLECKYLNRKNGIDKSFVTAEFVAAVSTGTVRNTVPVCSGPFRTLTEKNCKNGLC